MPKFSVVTPEGRQPRLQIDTYPGEEFTAEEAVVWMLNEIRIQLDSIDTRLINIEGSMPS